MIDVTILLVDRTSSIKKSIEVINANAFGMCFVVWNRKLIGTVTDGDIRRAILSDTDLDEMIEKIMNVNYVSLPIDSPEHLIRSSLSDDIKLIPLVDENGYIADVASAKSFRNIPISKPVLSGRESEYVHECLTSNWVSSQGPFVQRFEKLFEEHHPFRHAITTSNGTTALHLALVALGVGPGDEVIVPDLTFAATINSVINTGATPVMCEVDIDSWCIDFVEAEKLINDKTKAIMPVHLYGQVANMDALESLLSRHDLLVIEDCAEALGSSWHGKPAGTFGDAATFSFFGNKIITTGEGGMVLFKDPNVAEHAKVLRDHGMNKNNKYWHEFVGFNYRLTNIQAAIGVAQMEQFNNIISKKRIIADAYKQDLQLISAIDCLPGDVDGSWNTFWLYTIRLKSSYSPQEVISDLLKLGIGARPIFYPLHLMPPYEKYKTSDSLEISKKISRTGISLPSSVDLDHGTVKFISKKLRGLLEK